MLYQRLKLSCIRLDSLRLRCLVQKVDYCNGIDGWRKQRILLSLLISFKGSYPLKHGQGFIGTAGKYGSSVGKMVLTVDTNNGNLALENGRLNKTTYKGRAMKICVLMKF